ncbi:MAG: macro domain-containing protein [Firmicutes bacterium]|nr:macro domain-containing protein [Bacillota bacterium]
MSSITVVKRDITTMRCDCIVNVANSALQAGGGVCGAIFSKAGHGKLQAACDEIGGCPTGSAVITPGFDLFAKYVIHAVGPVWHGGNAGEQEALYECYRKSLELAADNDCTSIAFPLISSGIFGYPKEEAWEVAVRSCADFIDLFEGYDMDIYFAVIDDIAKAMGERVLEKVLGETEEEEYESNIIEAEFEGEESPFKTGAPEVERAISEWFESESDEDLEEALDVIFRKSGEGLKVIVPVIYDDDGEEMYQMISGEDDDYWMACFTNNAEKVKGEKSSSIVISMREAMEKSSDIDNCSGLAINPWGDGIFIPEEVVEDMLSKLEPKTQDQMDFEAGLEAYADCRYDEAAQLFAAAADSGNVNALARLGLCYYLGRGVAADKKIAIEMWIKTAIFGDIFATYMLGDAYRAGETGDDADFSRTLYHKAFLDACEAPNIWTFPEAALRAIKYNRGMFEEEAIENIASDMVDAFSERIDRGDKTCAAVYAESLEILKKIRG